MSSKGRTFQDQDGIYYRRAHIHPVDVSRHYLTSDSQAICFVPKATDRTIPNRQVTCGPRPNGLSFMSWFLGLSQYALYEST